MPEKITVLGIRFDNVNMEQTLDFIFKSDKKAYICTPNPEMILEAQNNKKFKDVLNNSLLNIADGIGILWAATQINNNSTKLKAILNLPLIAIKPGKFKNVLKERVTGVDLLQNICKKAANNNKKLFFLGAEPGIAELAKQKLKKKYNNLIVTDTYAGSPSPKHKEKIIKIINKTDAEILFVAYGAPKQELWISEVIDKLDNIKIAIGIGGAFDFIAGKRKRAPEIMQKIGLEWLFRLIQEPRRIKRIYNATVKFPLKVIKKL